MSKSLLILGGAGYLGQCLAKTLSANDEYDVTVGDIVLVNSGFYKSVLIDVLDSVATVQLIKDYEIVINCIGQITNPSNLCYKLNSVGIKNIVDGILKSEAILIHLSSVVVYGTTDFADENTVLNPETEYAAFKAFAEYIIIDNLPKDRYCICRISNLYAENQEKGFFAYLQRAYNSNRKLAFNHDGSMKRFFLHVNDCSLSIKLVIKKNLTGVYNIATDDCFSIKEIIEYVSRVARVEFDVEYSSLSPKENIGQISTKKFIKDSDFHPSYNVENFLNNQFLVQ